MVTLAPTAVKRNSPPAEGVDIIAPRDLGMMDAEEGLGFNPEMYFVIMADLLAYTEGFEMVAGESEITRSFKAQWPEEEEESIEDDYEFIRRGGAGGFL